MADIFNSDSFLRRRLAALLAVIAFPVMAAGQFSDMELIHYFSTVDSFHPVKLHTEQNDKGVIRFTASNDTYYPFRVTVRFRKMENFTTAYKTKDADITHGKNILFDLTIRDPERGFELDYEFSFALGTYGTEPEQDFIYLIPLKPGSVPTAGGMGDNRINNSFVLEQGDTVFCSRKGRVAALPGVEGNTFRITDSRSLEILHDDGTLMVYGNLRTALPEIRQGMIVYPGDPLAVAQERFILLQHLVSLGSSEQLETVPILYLLDESSGAQFSRIEGRATVLHPESIIIREMTPREIRLREKKSGQPR